LALEFSFVTFPILYGNPILYVVTRNGGNYCSN